jgi:hypothetical protein
MSDRSAAEEALHDLEAEAFVFSSRFIQDAGVRHRYVASVRQFTDDLRRKMDARELTPREAAEQANVVRNHLLDVARLRSSDIGRATAEKIKPQGLTLEALLERYAQRTYQRAFAALSEAERDTVYLKIVEAPGRPNMDVTATALRLGRLGRGLMVLSLAIAVYDVATAKDRSRPPSGRAWGSAEGSSAEPPAARSPGSPAGRAPPCA